ncbi:MAG: PASTA domain-containing protein, partial [Sciscionella sp.]|nr:PASTA domain-containing protein [Sciscionella sp.]
VANPALASDPVFVRRFEREARAAANLRHPNVVAVHDFGHTRTPAGEYVYLVMELVDGGTLRDLLDQRGALRPALAISVLDPVLSALAAAHGEGLVHRDVKPENVLIGANGAVKVADFGLVRAISAARSTSASVIMGTVAYLSPEQVSTGDSDPRSDVYSAGVLLYEMLTGTVPYTGDNAISVAYRHVNDDIPAPGELRPELPPALDDLTLRATRRDPDSRPVDASAFVGELHRIRHALGLSPVPIPVPAHTVLDSSTAQPSTADPVTASMSASTADSTAPSIDGATVPSTRPAKPATSAGPAGPRGTKALSRAEYDALAASMPSSPAAAFDPASLPGHQPQAPLALPSAPPALSPDELYRLQRKRKRRTALIWITVVLLLAAAIGTTAWWFGSGRWTAVPQVTGKDTAGAEHAIADAHLSDTVVRQHDNTVPAGAVIGTDPGPGTSLLRGSQVKLTVSTGRPVVPGIAQGTAESTAEHQIRDAGLTPKRDPSADNYDNTVPAGTVLSLNPTSGTQVSVGATVSIGLSKGPPPKPVPNVAGMSHDDAFTALQQAGFQPYDAPKQFSATVDGGKVISTTPAAGTTLGAGDDHKVGVVVSNAVTVPDLTFSAAPDAQQQLQQLGLVAQFGGFGGGGGTVYSQSPAGGTRVQPGSTVTLATI